MFIGRIVLECIEVLLSKVSVKLPELHQSERIQSEDMEAAPVRPQESEHNNL